MIIGDFVTLEGFQEEMLKWLKDVKKQCVPGGSIQVFQCCFK